MRLLFTFAGGRGHLEPLLPFARAAQQAGHTVAIAGWRPVVATVPGIDMIPMGAEPARTARLPLAPPNQDREDRVLRDRFAGTIARDRAAALIAIARDWRPDVVVSDEVDFGAMVAADTLGLPRATVLVIATESFIRPAVVGPPIAALRASHGLAESTEPGLILSPFPASLRPAEHRFRLGAVPTMRPETPPLVSFTLGTVFNQECGDLFERVIAGLRQMPIRLVVTVGDGLDPADFGRQPANVGIERFVPQADLLPRCSLVVSHGGSGSLLGALAHGLPSLLLPMGADQLLNGARVESLGVGHVLNVMTTTAAEIRNAAAALLADPADHTAARRIQAEIAALPGPEAAITLLERLSRG